MKKWRELRVQRHWALQNKINYFFSEDQLWYRFIESVTNALHSAMNLVWYAENRDGAGWLAEPQAWTLRNEREILNGPLYYGRSRMLIHCNDVIMGAMASQITSLTSVYSTVYSGADQRKHQSSASLAFVRGIYRWPVNSPHKRPVTRKMFPFDDVSWYEKIWKPGHTVWRQFNWSD